MNLEGTATEQIKQQFNSNLEYKFIRIELMESHEMVSRKVKLKANQDVIPEKEAGKGRVKAL